MGYSCAELQSNRLNGYSDLVCQRLSTICHNSPSTGPSSGQTKIQIGTRAAAPTMTAIATLLPETSCLIDSMRLPKCRHLSFGGRA